MKRFMVFAALIAGVAIASAAYAQTGNGAPSGAHYNLNIHGVEKGKTANMTGSNRHTIFVALGGPGGEAIQTNIWLTRGEFAVCDGNGFDQAYGCDGLALSNKIGAVFQLPCNTNLTGTEELVPCTAGDTAAYEIWARALGTPKGNPSVTITTCAFDATTGEEICSSENVLLVRTKGKQTFQNVTNQLSSLVANIDDDPALERVALFAGDLQDWFWKYVNSGVRLVQIRFYLL